MRSLGATKFDILRKVGIQRSLPYFFASLMVSITLAFVGAVISETLASNDGIGYLMVKAQTFFQTDVIVVCLLVYAVLGVLSDFGVRTLEGRLLRWQPGR